MKNILFILQFDSFIKTLTPVIENLIKDGYRCDVILLKKRFKKEWISRQILNLFSKIESKLNSFVKIYQRDALKIISKNEYSLIVSGTSNTRLIVSIKNLLKKKSKQSKIASGYVGALLNNDFESFKKGLIRRSSSDLIWVPGSDAKKMIYELDIINKDKTLIIDTGLPRFDELYKLKDQYKKTNHNNNIVFFEQPTFPETKKERIELVNQLIKFAELNSRSNIIIKPRFSGKVGHAHRPKYLLQDILNDFKIKPLNITISNDDIYVLFKKCKLALTISSTAGLESLLVKIPTYFIKDFCGTINRYGSNDFSTINATITFDNLFQNKFPTIDYSKIKNIVRFDGENTKRLTNAFKKIIQND